MTDGAFVNTMTAGRFSSSFLCILLLLTTSCKVEPSFIDDSNSIVVRIGEDNQIKAFIKGWHILQLDDSASAVGYIDKIKVKDNKYFILDRHISHSISCFDETGKYIGGFGKQGRGPGEYVEPTDFVVTDSSVVVLDQFSRQILSYRLDGAFIAARKLPCSIYEMELSPDGKGFYFMTGANRRGSEYAGFEIIKTDGSANVLDLQVASKYKMNYSSGLTLHSCGNKLYYSKPFRTDIIELTEQGPKVSYKLLFEDNGLPSDFESRSKGDFEKFRNEYPLSKYNVFSGSMWESESYVCFGLYQKGVKYVMIYEKASRQTLLYPQSIISNKGQVDSVSVLLSNLTNSVYVSEDRVYVPLNNSLSESTCVAVLEL